MPNNMASHCFIIQLLFYNNDIFLVQAKWASQIGVSFCVVRKNIRKNGLLGTLIIIQKNGIDHMAI
ncbi:MAG: hypothetical protein EGR84_06695 [Coprococcus catus]|nr:hypothetical protein [Coprococcus catus]